MRPSRAFRVSIDGDKFVASLPPALARDLSATLEGEPFRVIRKWSGNRSECSLLQLRSGVRLVLKQAAPDADFEYEAEMLARFADSKHRGLLPAVVEVFPAERAVLMEFAGSRDLRAALRKGGAPAPTAETVLAGLAAYHRTAGKAFGDFHPSNVFVHGGAARFIDPSPPGSHGAAEGEEPVVTDLAYWTFASMVNLPWDGLRSPGLAWRLLRLNVELVRLGLAGAPERQSAVQAQVRRLFRDLWGRWPRDKAIVLIAAPVAWAVLQIASRLPAPSAPEDAVQVVRQPQRQRDDRQRHRRRSTSRHH